MLLKRNTILTGIILGILLPLAGFWIIKGLFVFFTNIGWFDPNGFSESWRLRTISLLAICLNIFPFNWYRKNRFDESMRGLIFPTTLFVIIWVIRFQDAILGG